MNSNWKAKVSAGTTFGFVLVGGILHQATVGRERAVALRLDQTTTVRVASLNPSIEPGRKGNTYYFLESRAVEVISRYDDGIQLTAQRGSDGALRVRASISGEDGAPQLIVSNGLRYRVNTGEWGGSRGPTGGSAYLRVGEPASVWPTKRRYKQSRLERRLHACGEW